MKRKLFNIFCILYIVMAITITLCLLSYNEFDVCEFGNKMMVSLDHKVNDYDKGTIIFITKAKNVEIGQVVYYFDSTKNLVSGEILESYDDDAYLIDGNMISKASIVGSDDGVKKISYLGYAFSILTSKLGYLLIIIFPVLFLFLYEIYLFGSYIKTIRSTKGDSDEAKSG